MNVGFLLLYDMFVCVVCCVVVIGMLMFVLVLVLLCLFDFFDLIVVWDDGVMLWCFYEVGDVFVMFYGWDCVVELSVIGDMCFVQIDVCWCVFVCDVVMVGLQLLWLVGGFWFDV